MPIITGTDVLASWRTEAACRPTAEMEERLESAWINEHHVARYQATMICRETCPVRMECLHDAVRDNESEGLRGGYWFSSGALLSKDRNRLEVEFPHLKREAKIRHRAGITNAGRAS